MYHYANSSFVHCVVTTNFVDLSNLRTDNISMWVQHANMPYVDT